LINKSLKKFGLELVDKVVVVTGGASGIGAATVKLFSSKGATVVIGDLNEGLAQEMISQDGKDSKLSFVSMNVSDFENVKVGLEKVVADHGKIDIMVCNAGVANKEMVRTADHTLEEWDRVIGINQTGVFYCMKLALRQMMVQGYGNIVNVASLAGLKASGKNLAYSASKFAVVGMTKSAALEYVGKNIRINCVCPSYTESALLDQLFATDERYHDKLLQYMPMKRFGQPEEIAQAIYWLSSDNSSFVTGQALTLGGGSSL